MNNGYSTSPPLYRRYPTHLFTGRNGTAALDKSPRGKTSARNNPPANFNVHKAAAKFWQATYGQVGTDIPMVKAILKHVHDAKAQDEFTHAMRHEFEWHGRPAANPMDVLYQEFAPNGFKALFRKPQLRSCQDIYRMGRDAYRSSAWDYRLSGAWDSLGTFVTVYRQHPFAAAAITAAIAVLSNTWGFLGGASGIVILGWCSVNALVEEFQAAKIKKMNAEKAAHLTMSGENMVGFLITAMGIQGIIQSYNAGMKAAQPAWKGCNYLGAIWNATKSQVPQGNMNLMQKFLFISGLFDNVLEPFNAFAEHVRKRREAAETREA